MPEPVGGRWGPRPEAVPQATQFLQGPQSRVFELGQAFRVFMELIKGFRKFHFIGPCVTVFGSARFDENHPSYRTAREVGRLLAALEAYKAGERSHPTMQGIAGGLSEQDMADLAAYYGVPK